jgi:hypothetical protein
VRAGTSKKKNSQELGSDSGTFVGFTEERRGPDSRAKPEKISTEDIKYRGGEGPEARCGAFIMGEQNAFVRTPYGCRTCVYA